MNLKAEQELQLKEVIVEEKYEEKGKGRRMGGGKGQVKGGPLI